MSDSPAAPSVSPQTLMVNPKTGKQFRVPPADVEAARRDGFIEAPVSATAALGHGLLQGATLGYSDELKGALGAIQDAMATGRLSQTQAARAYLAARDDYRRKLAAEQTAHPIAYGAGRVLGGAATGLAASVVPGLQGAGGAALAGAADALGNNAADLTTKEGLKDAAKDVALGTGVGAKLHAVGQLARGAAPALRTAAEDAYLSQHALTPVKLGEPSQAASRATAGRALDETAPGVFAKPHAPEQAHAATAAQRADSAAKLDALYGDFDSMHGPTVDPAELSQRLQAASADAVKSKPELLPHVRKAVRALSPDEFDAAEKGWGIRQSQAAQAAQAAQAHYQQQLTAAQALRAKAMTPAKLNAIPLPQPPPAFHPQDFPWQRWTPKGKMTLQQTQDAINRMRDIGAVPEGKPAFLTKDELNADKDVFTPAWHTSADTMRDSIAAHGGPEASAAINPERVRYGQLRGLEKAHGAAERGTPPAGLGDKIKSAAAVPLGAAGAAMATGHGAVPAALAGVAAAGAQHVLAPRAPQLLDAASKAAGAMAGKPAQVAQQTLQSAGRVAVNHAPEVYAVKHNQLAPTASQQPPAQAAVPSALDHLAASFGRFFTNVSPERRAVIEHKLIQVSPTYAKLRQDAAKEIAAKAEGGAPGTSPEVDPHGAQNPQVNVTK